MSLHLVRIVLFLPFLSIVSAGTHPSTSSLSFSMIQTPLFLNVSEGSDVTLNCNTEGNVSSKWFIKWKKMGGKHYIKNSTWSFVITNNVNKSSTLILKSTVIADSGIYHCETGDLVDSQLGNTSVTIWEKPNLVVNQTPQQVSKKAGGNVTITCNFSRVHNISLVEVKWYKDKLELRNPKHSEKFKQKVFLKLVNVNLEDSGNYVCTIRIRNRTGSGNGTWVQVAGREKPSQNIKVNGDGRQPGSPQENTGGGIGIPVGVGIAVGTLIFLLLLGAVVWRSKRKNKGASENPSEAEPVASKEARKHTSLTKQESDVTYADIRFHRREVPPDAEVVYAEVRLGTKRPENRDRGTQSAGLH
ncbi:tyrosine-protein kinase-like otk isoform X2 [Crotalus tigris]|uniref:tyrosine-protein kinase-like otk isoform X2 n=1 Tax=Crotalus tigris TaxID=88082 RepID=UPI00192F3420|nr:tyrosine-protein kinase-like otk isoform X2 [Crotalus tigris]